MDAQEALAKVQDTFNDLIKNGFMLEGSLTFFKPALTGIMECQAIATLGEVSSLTFAPVRIVTELPTLESAPQPQALIAGLNHGMTCAACGSPNLKPGGTCFTCMDCGQTTGCG